MNDKIATIRKKIDIVDSQLAVLVAKRAECAIEMKRAKGDKPIYRPSREAEILKRVQRENVSKLPDESMRAIFTEIVTACRNLEQELQISYLGPEGSYSHAAAQKMFGLTSKFIPQLSLHEVLSAVESGMVDVAFLPIENSSEGSVIETHRLLFATSLGITGEFILPIRHNLLSISSNLKAIKTVYAHPQAHGQCREWLQHNLPLAKLVNADSNSKAASIALKQPHSAAIASKQAASIVGIPVLESGINDFSDNQTRFIALSSHKTSPTNSDKTSIICTVRDKIGALHELLGIFEKYKINLTRLESQPHPDHEYTFFIDFEGHRDTQSITKALEELGRTAKTCKILGSYPKE